MVYLGEEDAEFQGGSRFEVFLGRFQNRRVLLEHAYSEVTLATEKSSNIAGRVIVIDLQILGVMTDVAELRSRSKRRSIPHGMCISKSSSAD